MNFRFISYALPVAFLFFCNVSFAQTESERFAKALTVLGENKLGSAYSNFIDLYLIVSPHPDKELQAFIARSRKGDKDAFAFVAYLVWQGYAGFRTDRPAAKFALLKAMKDGSATAAVFIAQTFQQSQGTTDTEKLDAYSSALYWYGVAAGMGEPRAHEFAMKIVNALSGGNLDSQQYLMSLYNRGMEDGASKETKGL